MWVFIKTVIAGALIIILFSSMATVASSQPSEKLARNKTSIITMTAQQNTPLTLKFDGIDLASFEASNAATVERDIYSRVRSAVKRAGIKATPTEMDRATKKIIKFLNSDNVRKEIARNKHARININVDLTFQPLTTAATFRF